MFENTIELRHRLQEARKDRFPIVFVCPGSGQVRLFTTLNQSPAQNIS